MLNTAIRAARRGATIIQRASNHLDHIVPEKKGYNDFVSEVDRNAEKAIIQVLLEAYPNHAILAEESGQHGDSEYIWVIDPLDGTTNFLHGFPQYAVSIALMHHGIITQGVVYDPCRNELFTATRGVGAFLNDRRIRVSATRELSNGLIGTGFPHTHLGELTEYLTIFQNMLKNTTGLRRPGAAALDLAYVACGRLDGFFELGLKIWDIAAGALLILEAGGLVTDLEGNDQYLSSGNIVCSTPRILSQMLEIISKK